jgi:hypothetical protein
LREGLANGIYFRLCPDRGVANDHRFAAECVKLARLTGGAEMSVILTAEPPRAHFRSLKERPQPVSEPAGPLLPVSLPDTRVVADANWKADYARNRLTGPALDQRGILTTSVGWPLVACYSLGRRTTPCTVVFKVRDIAAEATWKVPTNRVGDQRYFWRIAAAIDDRVRTLVASPVRSSASRDGTELAE